MLSPNCIPTVGSLPREFRWRKAGKFSDKCFLRMFWLASIWLILLLLPSDTLFLFFLECHPYDTRDDHSSLFGCLPPSSFGAPKTQPLPLSPLFLVICCLGTADWFHDYCVFCTSPRQTSLSKGASWAVAIGPVFLCHSRMHNGLPWWLRW